MSQFPIQPMHNNLLIKKVDLVEESLIVVAGEKEQTQNTARVLAVGPGRYSGKDLIPCSVKPGDLILTGGVLSLYKVGKEEFTLISENSVVGIIDESKIKVQV